MLLHVFPGIPAVVVGISSAVYHDGYGTKTL